MGEGNVLASASPTPPLAPLLHLVAQGQWDQEWSVHTPRGKSQPIGTRLNRFCLLFYVYKKKQVEPLLL